METRNEIDERNIQIDRETLAADVAAARRSLRDARRTVGRLVDPSGGGVMKIGDTIRMEEPPVGTVLRVHDPVENFDIIHEEYGWRQFGKGAYVSWRSVISAWGPGSDPAIYFEVVELP